MIVVADTSVLINPSSWTAVFGAGVRGTGRCRRGHRAFWKAKRSRNLERDRKVNRALRGAGWRVLRIWEHDLAARLGGVRSVGQAFSLSPHADRQDACLTFAEFYEPRRHEGREDGAGGGAVAGASAVLVVIVISTHSINAIMGIAEEEQEKDHNEEQAAQLAFAPGMVPVRVATTQRNRRAALQKRSWRCPQRAARSLASSRS